MRVEKAHNEVITTEFLRHVLDAMPGMLVVRDAEAEIIYCNRALAEFLGLTVERISGMSQTDVWRQMGRPADQIKRWLAEDRKVLETGEGLEYIQEIIRPDGQRAFFHNFKVPVMLPDGRQCLLAQYADITERKRFERWRAKEEAVAAELVGMHKTAATYAREINNPLAGIIGLTQLLAEAENCPAELREMVAEIAEATRRIERVIRTMEAVETPYRREYLGRSVLLDLRDGE